MRTESLGGRKRDFSSEEKKQRAMRTTAERGFNIRNNKVVIRKQDSAESRSSKKQLASS